MPEPDEYQIPPEQERIQQLPAKILAYQYSLADGRAVELDELKREGVLDPADIEFLNSKSVTYKPHRLSDYHALDMFHMPISERSCVFIGPSGPPLKKRHALLQDFQAILESFLHLPRPTVELLLLIEFSEHDGMGVNPEMISYHFRSARWQEQLPAIRAVAAEFGIRPLQDDMDLGTRTLTFAIEADPVRIAAATVALLGRGCGFAQHAQVTYSAGALDER
jgi:hypothetical protein